jgi:uncharacterized protein
MVERPPAPASDRRDGRSSGRQALLVFAVTWVLVAALVRLRINVPLVGHLGSALVALAFLYLPSLVARWRGEDLVDYGFTTAPLGKGLTTAALVMLLVFPIFALGYLGFHEVACSSALSPLVPPGLCARYDGLAALRAPAITPAFLEFCATQLIVVALPEELFFRGMLLTLLLARFPPRGSLVGGVAAGPGQAGKLAGAGVGWALILTSLAFAVVHLPRDGDPRALATFFPALLFGWLRLKTGSLLAPTLVHAGSNILIRLLELMVMK